MAINDEDIEMQRVHDDVCFYYLCAYDFDEVIRTFELLETCDKPAIRYRLFIYIIITYARPFTKNSGRVKNHTLNAKGIVPNEHRELHEELMDLRNRVVAHTDVDFRNPRLGRLGMSVKGVYYENIQKSLVHKPVLKMVNTITGNLAMKITETRVRLVKQIPR